MKSSLRRVIGSMAAVTLPSVLAVCGGDTAPKAVASVMISATSTNPRVGEVTHVSATPVDEGGVQIQGVTCSFTSSAPAIASVDAISGAVTAVAAGTAVITATCGGKASQITLTVRPPLVTLTLLTAGTGSGAITASPAGGSYDLGTQVTITATANAGSSFTGFSGGGCGATSPCTLTLTANTTVTANFVNSETFNLSGPGTVGGQQTQMNDPSPPGCSYAISISVTSMSFVLGSTSGTGTATYSIGITAVGQTSPGSCTGLPYTETSSGNITVNGNSISGTLTHTGATSGITNQTLTITGTRNGSTISGTFTSSTILKNSQGTNFTSTGGPYQFSLTKQ